MQGIVFRKAIGRYWVTSQGRTRVCSISNRLRKNLIYPEADPSSIRPHVVAVAEITETDPVAIGDRVEFLESEDGAGVINQVLPRRNKLSRKAADKRPLEQVMAANIDQIIAVIAAAQPAPKWRLLDRYLANAEFLEVPALICITKSDLASRPEFADELHTYRQIGYPVILTSAVTGQGLPELQDALKDRVSVLLGKSGVGKTSLLNALQPGLGLKVQEVSERTGKGRHTTTSLEMFELASGGFVIDTPGIREFGLWNAGDADVARLFRELRPFLGRCRFGSNCTHSHEPDCAVIQAVEAGRIAQARYDSFLRMEHEAT